MHVVVATRYQERNLTITAPANYIDPSPVALQPDGWVSSVNRLPFRAAAHSHAVPSAYVSPFRAAAGKKNVLVTLGTVFSDAEVVRDIISSIDRTRFDVVATKGVIPGVVFPSDEDGLSYVSFVPLNELLNDVDIVVNAGGAGTVLGTLSRGLPMVVWPQGADQFINTERAAAAGVAVVVNEPSAIGAALLSIVEDGRIAAAAKQVAGEIASEPSADDVIEELVRQATAGAAAA
jgi:UDP:flavonoid glycosyltransferase YjiC (YdhE family)